MVPSSSMYSNGGMMSLGWPSCPFRLKTLLMFTLCLRGDGGL
jgi:hypothetical protein